MKSYVIPPDMNEKEKIIGGILNINQFFWIAGGLALGAIVFILTFNILGGTMSLILGGFFCLTGIPFVVVKINGLTLYNYLKLKRKFKHKVKKMPNIRKEVSF